MTEIEAKQVLDKIVEQVFKIKNPLSLDQFRDKFAFDVKIPMRVYDSTTNEETWIRDSTNSGKYMTFNNVLKHDAEQGDFMHPTISNPDMNTILSAWQKNNFTATEKYVESINIGKSDGINGCENVYMSLDYGNSKNVVFCDGGFNSEYVAACQRSNTLSNCIRVEGSREISNSFEVIWSAKVTNSMFINDCFDMYECIFCSHVTGKQFCIANMQFSEEEYFKLKPMIINWIFNN
jgi:hypothetical protein